MTLTCALALALPASASAADPALGGPASIPEGAGQATYTFVCGDAPNPLAPPGGLPANPLTDPIAPAVPSTITNPGVLTVSVTSGPSPAATEGEDYEPSDTAAVPCGPTPQASFDVPILDDAADELGERFTVTVSGTLAGAEFSQSIVTTIADNDDPIVAIGELTRIIESDSGTTTASLPVTLSQKPVEAATVRYATEASSAAAGSDFTAVAGQLVIPAGQTTGTIAIPIVGDTVAEGVEALYVNLLSADKATLDPRRTQGAIAIFDNDKAAATTVSLVRPARVAEGNRGAVNALFTVALKARSSQRVQVKWSTANGTANLADYAHGAGTVVFEPGQITKTISVDIKGDLRDEPAETFSVTLASATGAMLGNPKSAVATIVDDDGPRVGIARPVLRPKAMRVALKCPATAENCAGTLVAASGKLKLGRARFALPRAGSKTVKLRLSRKARNALRKRSRRVKLTATATDASGGTRAATRTVRLRLR